MYYTPLVVEDMGVIVRDPSHVTSNWWQRRRRLVNDDRARGAIENATREKFAGNVKQHVAFVFGGKLDLEHTGKGDPYNKLAVF